MKTNNLTTQDFVVAQADEDECKLNHGSTAIQELTDFELALVGGGSGDVILG